MRGRKFLLAAALVLGLAGCSSPGGSPNPEPESGENAEIRQETVLYLGTFGDWTNTSSGQLFRACCEAIEAESGGTLEIRIYDNGSLGEDATVLAGTAKGTVSMAASSPLSQWNVVPEASLLCVPGLFESVEEFNTFLDQGYRDTLEEYYRQAGLYLVACTAVSDQVLTSKQPIRQMEDFSGMVMGMENNPALAAYWNALGMQVQVVEPSQIYRALNQEQISAQVSSYERFLNQELYQYQRNLIPLNFSLEIETVVMNLEQFEALALREQQWIRKLGALMEESFSAASAEEQEPVDYEAHQVTCTYLTYQVREQMRQANSASLEVLRQELGDSAVDGFLAAVAAMQNQR